MNKIKTSGFYGKPTKQDIQKYKYQYKRLLTNRYEKVQFYQFNEQFGVYAFVFEGVKPQELQKHPYLRDIFGGFVLFVGYMKPVDAYYRDKGRRDRDLHNMVVNSINDQKRKKQRREQRMRQKKQFNHGLKQGDILYSSWGYDQTNIDFYLVTRVISDKSVQICEIGKKNLGSNGYGQDKVVADKNRIIGKKMRKIVSKGDYIKISSFEYAHKWDGKPCQETSAGWGH